MDALDTHLPNGCVGRQAFPMEAEGRQADFDPRQSEGCFVSLITVLAIHPQQGGDIRGADPSIVVTSPVPLV